MEKKLLRCPPQNPLTSPAKFSNNSPVSHNVQTINHGHANCAYFESGKPKNRGTCEPIYSRIVNVIVAIFQMLMPNN